MVSKKLPLNHLNRIKRAATSRIKRESQASLPGFDARSYMQYNPDIANYCQSAPDPRASALDHYLDYGIGEMRRVFADGVGIKDSASRLMPEHIHATPGNHGWLNGFRQLVSEQGGSLAGLITKHPRAAWLRAGFNFPSYAVENLDLLKEGADPDAITLHFLEFGLEKAQTGYPELWDPAVVWALYGIDLDETLNGPQALSELRRQKGNVPVALTEAEIFALHGFAPTLAAIFEPDYSHSVVSSRPATSRVQIIQNFCKTGWKDLQPIHPDLHFDPNFYDEAYAPLPKLPAGQVLNAALYRHWLSTGVLWNEAPNISQLGKGVFGTRVPEAILDQLGRFVMGSNGLNSESRPVEIFRHLQANPKPGMQWLDLSDRMSQSFVRILGDNKVIAGDTETGRWLYALVLEANPDHVKANMAMADLLQREGRVPMARTMRRKVPVTRENGWNSLNFVELLLEQGRIKEAAELLSACSPHVSHDIVMRNRRQELAHSGFWRIWDNVTDRAKNFGLECTQEDLRAITRAFAPEFAHNHADRSDPIRSVALVGNDDLYQCKLYRVDQKAEQLAEAGYNVQVFSPSSDLPRFLERLDQFQAVIFFRVPAFPNIMEAIVKAGQAGLATFYEIDDIVFDTEHFPPSYESYANQITRQEYDAMAAGVPLFERAMELCEYGIATTSTLREIMAAKVRSGQVFEHQNALGRLHLLSMAEHDEKQPFKKDGPIVLFYGSGTKAHKEDFHDILEPALAEMIRRHGKRVEVRLIGHFDKFKHLDTRKPNVKILTPVWDFEEYCSLVAEADINLSVLSSSILTDAKSEIKWMEAAMFGTPSVVSATRTHREKIIDGETGILCESTEDFTRALNRLIADDDARMAMGLAAREKVLKDYSLQAMEKNLRKIFNTVRPEQTRKKRIVIVNVFYPPQAIGGATRVVHDNVRLLKEKYGDEFEIDVICSYEGGTTPYHIDRYARDGVRVWAIATPNQPDVDHQITDISMGHAFDRILECTHPDLVHFHCIQRLTTSIVDATRMRKTPYVITMHDAWWISRNQFVLDEFGTSSFYDYRQPKAELPIRAQKLRRSLMGAKALLPVSHGFAEVVEHAGLTGLRTIENGVSNFPIVTKMPSANGKVRLAHIGGANRHKGYHHVRNALLTTKFDNLELLVIDHALSADIEIKETWGSTTVLRRGKFSQDEIGRLYEVIDVLLAPSTWPESYGLVTREAAAAGAWIVASDQGGIGSDVIEGENGFVVDVSTHEGVKEALKTIDADPERYRHSPNVKAELRLVDDQVDELAELYRKL